MKRLAIFALALLASIVAAWAEFPFASPKIRSTVAVAALISQTDYTAGSLGSGDSDTRSTTANYFNSSGVLTSSAINTARFDYSYNGTSWVARGWLVEATATNIMPFSNTINAGGWTAYLLTGTTSALTGIDGTTSANEGSAPATGTPGFYTNTTTTTTGSTQISIYLKKGTWNFVQYSLYNGGTGDYATVVANLNTGAITQTGVLTWVLTSSSITNVANGWYLVNLNVNVNAGTGNASWLGPAPAATGNTFGSNSVISGTWAGTETFYWTDTQVTATSFPSSYIPVPSSSAVVRGADTAANSNWWNGTSGNYIMMESESESSPGTITRASYCNSGCTSSAAFAPVSVWVRRICRFNATGAGATAAQAAAAAANGTAC